MQNIQGGQVTFQTLTTRLLSFELMADLSTLMVFMDLAGLEPATFAPARRTGYGPYRT